MTDTIDRSAADDDHVLDHLIIRFAGDSGDGMQLTGDRFTSVSASFGNDLSTLPDFPAEIRAPAGTVNGVSAFQVNIADHKITTPGDEPNVLVAMNPAALMADLHRLEARRDGHRQRRRLRGTQPREGRLQGQPARRRHPRALPRAAGPMTSLTKEICAPLGVKPRDAERSKNFFALGLVSFMYTRPVDPTIDWITDKFGGNELVEAANKASFLAGIQLRRDDRGGRRPIRGQAGQAARRRIHQHHRQHCPRLGNRRCRSAGEAADHARLVPDHAGVRHSPRTVEAQALRDPYRAGRRRDRGDRHGARRCVRRASRRDHHQRPGCRLEERDDISRCVDRTAVAPGRHPARRAVDRPADQDRGVRPQHRAVRTAR
jgi:hypothetical protein